LDRIINTNLELIKILQKNTINKNVPTFAKSDLLPVGSSGISHQKSKDMEEKDCEVEGTSSQLSHEDIHMNHARGNFPSSGTLR
jgi:hypothetical protein